MPALLDLQEAQEQHLAVTSACNRIPPLWPLQNFVAVNPFIGLTDMPFPDAARLLDKVTHSAPLMDAGWYLRKLQDGTLHASHIRAALTRLGSPENPADPIVWLTEQLGKIGYQRQILTVAESLDRIQGTTWAAFIVDEISKWCSSYFDRGQASWTMPGKDRPLYLAWKRVARLDRNPEVFGLPGFRRHVENLPDSPEAAIEEAIRQLNIPAPRIQDFLHRQLITVFGWSAHAAFHNWQDSDRPILRQLLAIRLAYDTALLTLQPQWRCQISPAPANSAWTQAKYIAQLATELAFRETLLPPLKARAASPPLTPRPALQAVFCIDVRSEIYRRALEAQSPGIRTLGFAGFFGMAIEFDSSARCPVLLQPRYRMHREPSEPSGPQLATWKGLLNSPSATFSAIETAGPAFGLRILQQLMGHKTAPHESIANFTWTIPLEERLDLVAGALKNMSLTPENLAPVVLICGHGSDSENNPYASALDCGACGGHKGDINARLAASLMNDPAVRVGLRARGTNIPEDTVFVAGLHNTTTDDVSLLDADALSHPQRTLLEGWLQSASAQARSERAPSLHPNAKAMSPRQLHRHFRYRAADWSEVRPEWGLAGNAAFIAAPRSRTQGLNLHGRAFLHDYDATTDPDSSVLQLILTAPVIVASWINLQYYGSTVNNQLFGSGNKVLHNVVGTFGVWEGNGGDLRTGLPLQSLHDGVKWVHEPLRLQVFIEAPTARIDAVLRDNPSIRILVENSWLHLMAIEDTTIREWTAPSVWHIAA